jgi:Helix-turn-helix domain
MKGRVGMGRILLSVEEIAHVLGVRVQSIRRVYWRGEIPAYRINKIPRFDLGQIQRIFLTKGLRGSVRPRATRPPAIAGGAPRKKAPAR